MQKDTFKALVLDQQNDTLQAEIKELPREALPDGEVLVAVDYSSLNYKDGLAITGQGKIVRNFPMVPGIDFVGTVVESATSQYKPGDAVILTGWFVGERYWGGLAQLARVRTEWLVPLPAGMTAQQAMSIGTAGFTAMLAVMALEDHAVRPGEREVVVTGAAGGLGSIAIALLARQGHKVVASTGRTAEADYLKALGAHEIIDREVLAAPSKRPLDSERWGGAVDTVGGDTLAGLIRSMALHGSIAVCGNAGGPALNTTVFPFILRGVNLLGIDSVQCPFERRRTAWERLANELSPTVYEHMTQVIALADVAQYSSEILQGRVRGRLVVDVNA